jgi:hypothetical protein
MKNPSRSLVVCGAVLPAAIEIASPEVVHVGPPENAPSKETEFRSLSEFSLIPMLRPTDDEKFEVVFVLTITTGMRASVWESNVQADPALSFPLAVPSVACSGFPSRI